MTNEKEDTKKFYEMWKRQPMLYKIFTFPYKSILKEMFEIGFTNGVEWTFENLKDQKSTENNQEGGTQ